MQDNGLKITDASGGMLEAKWEAVSMLLPRLCGDRARADPGLTVWCSTPRRLLTPRTRRLAMRCGRLLRRREWT